MPNFNIIKETKYNNTFRNESIKGQFDLDIKTIKEQFSGNLDYDDKDWQIGLIVGSSGSGKSTIAKEIYKKEYVKAFEYNNNSVLDEMPKNKTTNEITKTFNSVGFATAWSWLKPYSVLSNGEKMRVDVARCLLEDNELFCFDEFTSVVDRTVAKTSSYAIQKAIKKTNKKFVAVSCHFDIIDWLQPDWIYDTDKKEFFFAKINTKDQKLKLKYINHQQNNGNYLKSITI